MANRLSAERIEQLWLGFASGQSVNQLAKKFGYSHRTVSRIRDLESWGARLDKIQIQVKMEADYDLGRAMAESLVMVRDYKARFRDALQNKQLTAKEVNISELERLAKLESFLLGGVEARTEVIGAFAGWTESDLENYANTGQKPTKS